MENSNMIENFVVKTDKGYFKSEVHCVAQFTNDIKNACTFTKFNASCKASFLYRFLTFETHPKVVEK